MQQASPSCAGILIIMAIVIGVLLLGISVAVEPPTLDSEMAPTADAIRATNAQIEIFLTQTQQARDMTPTP